MKKKYSLFVLLFAFCLVSNWSVAQKDSTIIIVKKSAVYAQIFGLGFTSINYDRVFHQKNRYKLAYRIGIEASSLYLNVDKRVVVLAEINKLFGRRNHFFETGVGLNTQMPSGYLPLEVNIGPNIGYRYQQAEGGVLFRANVYPLSIHVSENEQWVAGAVWFGISVGKSF